MRVNDALVKIDARATRAEGLARKKLRLRSGGGGSNARGNLDARMRGREDGKAVKLGHRGQFGGGRGRLGQ